LGTFGRTGAIYPGDFASGLELFPALENYFLFAISSAHTRRSTIRHRPTCFGTDPTEEVIPLMGDAVSKPPGIYRFCFPEWMLSLYANRHCSTIDLLARRTGSPGTAPERRCKSGMDGGFRAASLVSSPPLYLKTAIFLSKQSGPPHPEWWVISLVPAEAVQPQFH